MKKIQEKVKEKSMKEKIAKDRKVIPDPIDDRKFQEWKESGKSGILNEGSVVKEVILEDTNN